MIWVPIDDGGRAYLPVTDPRAIEYLNESRFPKPFHPPAPHPDPEKARKEQARIAKMRQIQRDAEEEEAERQIVARIISRATPPGLLVNVNTSDYDRDVIAVINYALHWNRWVGSHSSQVTAARESITDMREKSVLNSQNLILRDAERYLWGRSGIPVFSPEYGPTFTTGTAPFANGFYHFTKGLSRGANWIFGTTWGQANPNRPFSPFGGGFWFQMGLSHYTRYDRDNEDNQSHARKTLARPLTIGDVMAQRGFDPSDAGGVDRGDRIIDYDDLPSVTGGLL
jgi:hypothetical protein